jgi:hypothetical protein
MTEAGTGTPPLRIDANPGLRIFHRDDLRSARAALLRDLEAYDELLFAVERLGATLYGRPESLNAYRDDLGVLAQRSSLAYELPLQHPSAHLAFDRLYEIVREARNDAMHHGVVARHLSCRSIELSLILEDALMNGQRCISDYMVRSPLCAEGWQPLSLLRQHMLQNSFSHLPYQEGRGDALWWRLVSDVALAKALHGADGNGARKKLLGLSLEEAVRERILDLEKPVEASLTSAVTEVLARSNGRPILVLDSAKQLLGIATPFDLL